MNISWQKKRFMQSSSAFVVVASLEIGERPQPSKPADVTSSWAAPLGRASRTGGDVEAAEIARHGSRRRRPGGLGQVRRGAVHNTSSTNACQNAHIENGAFFNYFYHGLCVWG